MRAFFVIKLYVFCNARSECILGLEGLNEKGFSGSDVEREITWLQSKLENMFTIVEHELPVYIQKADGTVDETKVLGESEIQQYIRENTTHYAEDNLKNDVTSALAIHRLRGDSAGSTIENCRVIFVTNKEKMDFA